MAEEFVEAIKGAIALCLDPNDYAISVYGFDWEFADEDSAVGDAVEADCAAGGEPERIRVGFE